MFPPLVTIRVDKHEKPYDVHQGGNPTTYSTFVLGDTIKPPRDPDQPVVIVDSNGTYLTVVHGPRLEKMPAECERVSIPPNTSSLNQSTTSLSELSEEVPSHHFVTANKKATTANPRSPTAWPKCQWCGESDAKRYCLQCKSSYYCTSLCASGHWRHGKHYTSCVRK